jgi:glycosyltransferase involved in cell wall biosynthesis
VTEPRVSVIAIFFNEERFLAEAVESVLAQDFADHELLLVDDGSSDASTRIAQGYAAKRPGQVHYLEHPGHANRGMSATRNLGLAHAKGEYVAFIDADDRWRAGKLREQVALLDAHPEVGLLCGQVNYWRSWGRRG